MPHKSWYHKGLRFQCTGCGNCCTGTPGFVWVNKAEIEAMAAAAGQDVEKFQKKYVRLVGIRKSLVELSDGDCVFFDKQRRACKVYDARPRQCRIWPFWSSNLRSLKAWAEMGRDCPGADHGPLVPLKQIEAQAGVTHV